MGLRFDFALLVGLLCFRGGIAHGEETEKIAAERQQKMRALAESFQVFVDAERTRRAELQEMPIFRWSNPERGSKGGTLFLWSNMGRPHAMIGTWTYKDTKLSYELQSLSAAGFVAERKGQVVWKPSLPGLQFHPVVDAPEPAEKKSERRLQMRYLAKDFSAHLRAAPGSQMEALRMLSRPIYQYGIPAKGVTEGAMFAYSQGTDPEVLLLIEAREKEKESEWFYAFAPATSKYAEGRYAEQQVWSSKEFRRKGRSGTFRIFLYRGQ